MIAQSDLGRRILEVIGGQAFCGKCSKPSDGPRSCPFEEDVKNNPNKSHCECCEACAHDCLRDI